MRLPSANISPFPYAACLSLAFLLVARSEMRAGNNNNFIFAAELMIRCLISFLSAWRWLPSSAEIQSGR
jgi:hypothetical protein